MESSSPNSSSDTELPQPFHYEKGYSDWRYYVIPFFPLSHNNAYMTTRRGGRFLIETYAEYKDAVQDILRYTDRQEMKDKLYGDAYEMKVLGIFTENSMYHKNGNFRRMDVDGYLKLLIDCVFRYLEIDDSHLLKVSSEKIVIDPLPWKEMRYSADPVWDKSGGNVVIAVRTVPPDSTKDLSAEHEEMLEKAVAFAGYREPAINYNRSKKEQARRAAKENSKLVVPKKGKKRRND